MQTPPRVVRHIRRIGVGTIVGELRRRLASEEVNFGLRCDLEQLPPIKPAAIPLTLERCDGPFDGFDAELARATGPDYGRVLRRQQWYARGVRSMHGAFDEAGHPVYVQWLVTPADQHLLGSERSQPWPRLKPDEVLLEFAYTFIPSRGLGVMGDAMGRLIRVAADGGALSALTYVRDDNVPSLRGCAKVGFDLDHVRTTTTRLGVSRNVMHPPDDAARRRWKHATATRAPL